MFALMNWVQVSMQLFFLNFDQTFYYLKVAVSSSCRHSGRLLFSYRRFFFYVQERLIVGSDGGIPQYDALRTGGGFRGTVMVRQTDKTLEPLPLRSRYDNTDGGVTPCRYCDPHFVKIAREWPWEGRTHTGPDLFPRFRMVFHSKESGCISLPRCKRISMLELPTGPVLHGWEILLRCESDLCYPVGLTFCRTYLIQFLSLFCEYTRSSGRCVSSSVVFFYFFFGRVI